MSTILDIARRGARRKGALVEACVDADPRSMRQIARDAGVDPSTIIRAKRGQPVSSESARKIARELGLTRASFTLEDRSR